MITICSPTSRLARSGSRCRAKYNFNRKLEDRISRVDRTVRRARTAGRWTLPVLLRVQLAVRPAKLTVAQPGWKSVRLSKAVSGSGRACRIPPARSDPALHLQVPYQDRSRALPVASGWSKNPRITYSTVARGGSGVVSGMGNSITCDPRRVRERGGPAPGRIGWIDSQARHAQAVELFDHELVPGGRNHHIANNRRTAQDKETYPPRVSTSYSSSRRSMSNSSRSSTRPVRPSRCSTPSADSPFPSCSPS